MSSTARYSECASTGCSVAKAIFTRVEPRHRQALFPRPYAGAIHPPKHETFDLVARTNTDPKGIVRAVDVYTVEPWGLYMARPTPGRAQFHYLESWLLPSLGLRATVFHFNPGYELDQDFYLDVGRYTPRLKTPGTPRTTTSIWWFAPASAWSSPMSTSC